MHSSTSFLAATLAVLSAISTVSAGVGYPGITGETKCDGLVRPTWKDCEPLLAGLINNKYTAGPGYLAGMVFYNGNCQVRFVSCDENAAAFDTDGSTISTLAGVVKDSCGDGVGGATRYGQACVVVEDPQNTFSKKKRSVSRIEGKREAEVEEKQARRAPSGEEKLEAVPMDPAEKRQLEEQKAKREAAPYGENLDTRQCNPPPNPCFTYTELTFITNFRGDAFKVCENVLPDGAACTQTRAQTVTQGLDVGVEFGGNIADIVSVGASFTQTSSTANTETLATQITINCKDGAKAGYVVWYPYFEVTRGRCGKGSTGSCSGLCYQETEESCSMKRPIRSGFGQLTGEYGIMCI